MKKNVKYVYEQSYTGRLRARTVATETLVEDTIASAREKGAPTVKVAHGGDVCNSYGWPARTEACLVVAFPDGRAVAWLAELPANKVTYAGAADACFPGARWLFDGRIKKQSGRDQARAELISAAESILYFIKTPKHEKTGKDNE